MSASTVSVTANPNTARRRAAVVIGEKKTGLDLTGSENGVAVAVSSPASVDKVTGNEIGRLDLSHSIRGGETVVVKKTLPPNASSLPRRGTSTSTRKGSSKPEKARWKTVVSVFTKNLVLLLVLVLLAQMIRRLALNQGNFAVYSSADYDYERRIAEVESFLKTTTKMMQVQVEVVDRKIESEIAGLRNEVGKNIEDNASQLRKFDSRVERLEKFVSTTEWLAKDDFDKFLEEFKKEVGSKNNKGGDVNLDEVRAFAREIVEREIEKHAADGLGRVDYALASGGGMVVKHSEAYIAGKVTSWLNRKGVHGDAVKILKPSFGEPGECFPLKGSNGFVQIRLRTPIIPEAITIEHVAKSVAYDRSTAPKDCKIFGWFSGHDIADPLTDTDKMLLLSEFTYDLEKSNAQTFNVLDTAGSGIVDTIRLDFTSNHGSPLHTCIYRLRVHGHEPNPMATLAVQP